MVNSIAGACIKSLIAGKTHALPGKRVISNRIYIPHPAGRIPQFRHAAYANVALLYLLGHTAYAHIYVLDFLGCTADADISCHASYTKQITPLVSEEVPAVRSVVCAFMALAMAVP